jgi:hypothetical protein
VTAAAPRGAPVLVHRREGAHATISAPGYASLVGPQREVAQRLELGERKMERRLGFVAVLVLCAGALVAAPRAFPAAREDRGQQTTVEFVGRAVDAEGAPLARVPLLLTLTHRVEDGHGSIAKAVRTDREGHFRWVASDLPAELDGCVVRATIGRRTLRGSARFSTREGTVDLGDVRLEPVPLLVSGRILDPDGRAVARARVVVTRASEGSNPLAWSAEEVTGRDGRFFVEADLCDGDEEFEVAITAPEYRSVRRRIAVGEDLGELRLVRTRPFEARLDLPVAAQPGGLWVHLGGRLADGRHSVTSIRLPPDGRIRTPGLEPGSYDVSLVGPCWLGDPLPLWRGVVEPESTDGTKRLELDALDLRDEIAVTWLDVVGTEGEPVVRPAVAPLAPTTPAIHVDPALANLEAKFPVFHRREPVRARVSAPGFEPVEVVCEGLPLRVTLVRSR